LLYTANDHGGQIAPWEEENGFYAILVGDHCAYHSCVIMAALI